MNPVADSSDASSASVAGLSETRLVPSSASLESGGSLLVASSEGLAVTGGEARAVAVALVVAVRVDLAAGGTASVSRSSGVVSGGTTLERALLGSGDAAVSRLEAMSKSHAVTKSNAVTKSDAVTKSHAVTKSSTDQAGVYNSRAHKTWAGQPGTSESHAAETSAVADTTEASEDSATSLDVLLFLLLLLLGSLLSEGYAGQNGHQGDC